MALVATIDGVQVHSDKPVRNIINTRVEFADGSWCDVKTGEVVNVGQGEIRIGKANGGKSTEPITKKPERFVAYSLDLRQLTANVVVEPCESTDMEVTITGPESEVNAIHANVYNRALVIEGGSDSSHSGVTIVSQGGSTVIRGGRGAVISSGSIDGITSIFSGDLSNDSPTKVTVMVPMHTPVSIFGSVGDTRIGDIDGPLTAHGASGDVEAGSMTDVHLHVQGSGDIRVAEVNGDAVVEIQGSGDIDIDGGNISTLVASIKGSGDISIDAVAQCASLSVMGSGDIRVAHVVKQPSEEKKGSGRIRVSRVG